MELVLFMPVILFVAAILLATGMEIDKHREKKQSAIRAQEAAKEAERKRIEAEKAALNKKRIREAEAEAKAEAKRQKTLRYREELHEQKMRHARELAQLQANANSVPKPPPTPKTQETNCAPVIPWHFNGNNAFAGQTVAFTGTLKNMTRQQAIQAVIDNGGKAFCSMPAGTTMLVVGDKPGTAKLDLAEQRLGQIRKITAEQFDAMLMAPLTVTPEQFAQTFAK